MATHNYKAILDWSGSTGSGYDRYEREHRVKLDGVPGQLVLSSDAAFLGNGELANPEQLLLAAASSCQLLAFLALAARSKVDVLAYQDSAEAIMPADITPMRIAAITLRPEIAVSAGTAPERVQRLVDKAHEGCFIANSLNTHFSIEPTIEIRDHVGDRA